MIQQIFIGIVCALFGGLLGLLFSNSKKKVHDSPCTALQLLKQTQDEHVDAIKDYANRINQIEKQQGEDRTMFKWIQDTLKRIESLLTEQKEKH